MKTEFAMQFKRFCVVKRPREKLNGLVSSCPNNSYVRTQPWVFSSFGNFVLQSFEFINYLRYAGGFQSGLSIPQFLSSPVTLLWRYLSDLILPSLSRGLYVTVLISGSFLQSQSHGLFFSHNLMVFLSQSRCLYATVTISWSLCHSHYLLILMSPLLSCCHYVYVTIAVSLYNVSTSRSKSLRLYHQA